MSTKNAPLVSICLPVYNGARTLRRAIDSLISQSYKQYEIIICDDGSTDDTPKICSDYAKKHSQIYFEVNPKNLGDVGMNNFRKTLSMAQGKYSVWASQDDIWHPDYLKLLTQELEKDSGSIAAMGATKHFVVNKGKEWALESRLTKEKWPQNNAKITNYFNFFYQRGHSEQLRQNINPELVLSLFIHGVVRTEIFRETIKSLGKDIISIRPVISQWPLSGGMIYVDEVLFYKEELTSFLSPKNDLSEAEKYLDKGLLHEFKRRKFGRTDEKAKPVSKYNYIFSLLKSHVKAGNIPLYYKFAPILLFASYLLRLSLKPVLRLFKKKSTNNKFNLLKTSPKKFKNLSPKSPLP